MNFALSGNSLMRLLALIATATFGLDLASVGTASAATSDITITSPTSPVPSGTSFTVAGTNNTSATIRVFVWCTNTETADFFDAPPGEFAQVLDGVQGPDNCDIENGSPDSSDMYATFQIATPPVHLSYPTLTYSTFYPIVHDGYRDTVRFSWNQIDAAQVNISVLNSSGSVVRTGRVNGIGYDDGWTWNGENNNGNLVAPGQYQIRAVANDNTISRYVDVVTKLATVHKSIRKHGYQSGSATRGRCYYRFGPNSGPDEFSITLDCRGGRYARATFNFKIPSNAKNLFWDWKTPRTYLDFCCRGRITNRQSRPSKTSAKAVFQVTGWRALMIRWVSLDYDYRTRI